MICARQPSDCGLFDHSATLFSEIPIAISLETLLGTKTCTTVHVEWITESQSIEHETIEIST